jgi:hypothetical protein
MAGNGDTPKVDNENENWAMKVDAMIMQRIRDGKFIAEAPVNLFISRYDAAEKVFPHETPRR